MPRKHRQRRLSRSLSDARSSNTRPNAKRWRRIATLERFEDRFLLAGDIFANGTLIGLPVDVTDTVAIANEVDQFTIDLDGGQTISVRATASGGLAPAIEVLDPLNIVLDSSQANANGTALLQTMSADLTGTYTVRVTGAANSTGNYGLAVLVNAAVDADAAGSGNDSVGTAQGLDGSFVATAVGSERGAVVGELDSSDDFFRFSLADGEIASLSATGDDEGLRLELYDTGGTLLAVGSNGSIADQYIGRFRDATTDGVATDYVARLARGSAANGTAYSLLVTRGSELDTEDNTSLSMAQSVQNDVLGGITVQDASGTTLLTDFTGMDSNSTSCGCQPPDTHGAVGLDHYVEVVNTAITIYNKDGSVAQPAMEFDDFFNPTVVAGENFLFDPVVAYDEQVDRFVVVILSAQSSTSAEADVLYAISDTSDPTEGFTEQHRFDFGGISPGLFTDYPKIGWNADAHVVSLNMFGFSFEEVNILAIDKSTVLDANSATIQSNIVVGPNGVDDFTAAVATMHDAAPGDPIWLVEETNFNGGNSIRLLRWDNPLTSANFSQWDIPVASYGTPPDAPQGGGGTFTTNDARMLNAELRDGRLLATHAVGVGGRALARWYEFDVSSVTPSLTQQGDVDPGPGKHTYFPSIAINPQGDIGITYMQSSSTEFVSMYVTGQAFGSGPGTLSPAVLVKAGDENYSGFRGGDYSSITVDPVTGTFWAANEVILSGPAPNPLWSTWIAEFVVAPIPDVDWFHFPVELGDALTIETFTPFAGPNEVVNFMDPNLELYAPDGTPVAADDNSVGDGLNASLTYVATQAGEYRLRVGGTNDSQGTYYLSVDGSTAPEAAPFVATVTPVDGLKLTSFPTTVVVTFSEAILSATVSPADLRINGIPATAVQQLDGSTFEFDTDSAAFVGDGTYTIDLAGGSVSDLQTTGNTPFTSTFDVDTTGPTILSTSWNGGGFPADGQINPGPLTFAATFDESLFTLRSARRGLRTPGADDVIITDVITGTTYQPVSFDFDNNSNTFTADFSYLPEGTYTLELISGDGAFEDIVGNDLDGEPLGPGLDATPTGNGIRGGNYSLDFVIDITTSVTVNPFERANISGDLVRRSTGTSGILNTSADEDQFDFQADAGESFSAVLTTSDATTVMSVTYDGMTYTAPGPGEAVVVPPQVVTSSGTVSLQVSGTVAAAYQLDVYRNAVAGGIVESTAVALDESFLSLGDGGRYAAVGQARGSMGEPVFDHYNAPSRFIDISTTGTALNLGDDSEATIVTTVGNVILPAGQVTVGNNGVVAQGPGEDISTSNTSLPTSSFAAALAVFWDDIDSDTGNVYWQERLVDGINTLIVQWDNRPRYSNIGSATFQVQVFATGPIAARYVYEDVDFGNAQFDGGASATIGYQTNATTGAVFSQDTASVVAGDVVDIVLLPATTDIDEYTVDLTAAVGARVDVILGGPANLSGQTLELVGPGGSVVAVGSATPLGVAPANYDLGILGYQVNVPGIYTVRASFDLFASYDLLVTSDVVYDTEPNLSANALRSLDDVQGALGFLSGGAVSFTNYNAPGLFIDIASTGTALNLADDSEATITTTVGNPLFPAGSVTVGNNGGIASGSGVDISTSNTTLPSSSFAAALLPLWDDIDADTGNVYWEERLVDGISTLIVQWDDRPRYSNIGDATFQLQLFASGPVAARFAYRDVDFGNADFDFGASATVGYQISPTIGGQFSINQPSLANGDVVDISLQETDTYAFTLAAGETITWTTATPLDQPMGQPVNALDPQLAILDLLGSELAVDLDSASDGKNARLQFTSETGGSYLVAVTSTSGFGEYFLSIANDGSVDGDFDNDGSFDCDDIDALVAVIAGSTDDPQFDLTGDGQVDTADLDAWLAAGAAANGFASSYLYGDANLDGSVDVSDFNIWNTNKFTNTAAWCSGDFNADGFVDVTDFNLWNLNKFQSTTIGAPPILPMAAVTRAVATDLVSAYPPEPVRALELTSSSRPAHSFLEAVRQRRSEQEATVAAAFATDIHGWQGWEDGDEA